MRFKKRREAFRSILEGDRCVHPASVFDPISARIAEDLGFETGMFAGSVASLTVLGAPDHHFRLHACTFDPGHIRTALLRAYPVHNILILILHLRVEQSCKVMHNESRDESFT